MPQNLYNGITVPINSDAYNLTSDLQLMGMTSNIIMVVNSQAARDAQSSAVTAFAGMIVCRADIAGYPLEVWDGTRWNRQTMANIGQGTAVPTYAAGVTTVTTNNNGDFTVTLPTAFGTALKAATLNDATDPATLGAVLLKVTMGSSDKTKITGRAYNTSGTALNTVTFSTVWTAFGY